MRTGVPFSLLRWATTSRHPAPSGAGSPQRGDSSSDVGSFADSKQMYGQQRDPDYDPQAVDIRSDETHKHYTAKNQPGEKQTGAGDLQLEPDVLSVISMNLSTKSRSLPEKRTLVCLFRRKTWLQTPSSLKPARKLSWELTLDVSSHLKEPKRTWDALWVQLCLPAPVVERELYGICVCSLNGGSGGQTQSQYLDLQNGFVLSHWQHQHLPSFPKTMLLHQKAVSTLLQDKWGQKKVRLWALTGCMPRKAQSYQSKYSAFQKGTLRNYWFFFPS